MGAAEWTGYSSPTAVGTTYASFQHPYEQPSSLPSAALPGDATSAYTPSDFHCGSSQAPATAYNGSQFTSLTNWSNEIDQYNYGYNGYQYSYQPPTQPQYPPTVQPPPPPTQATMVLCPQLYSTVNQNQIHLHLHGTEKFMEYLGNTNSTGFPAAESGTNFPLSSSLSSHHQSQQRQIENSENELISQEDNVKQHQEHSVVDNENCEQVVWRPY